MKMEQLKDLLKLYCKILQSSQSEAVLRLDALAERLGNATLSNLKKISQPSPSQHQASLTTHDSDDGVYDALMKLESLLRSAGAKSSKEVGGLAKTLRENFEGSSEAFADTLSRAKPLTPKKDQPVRLDIVRAYADDLATYEHDNNAFDQLIARVKSDRNVRKQEMHELANRFLGYRIPSSPKDKLLQKIVDMQAKNARQEARTKA